jgi:hypothetical protein
VLIIALLLIVGSSIAGLAKASDTQNSYEAMTCSVAITIDDIINGNTTSNGAFFIGLTPFIASINQLFTKMGDIKSALKDNFSLGSSTSPLYQVNNDGDTFSSSVSNLPTNSLLYGDGTFSLFPNAMDLTKTGITNVANNLSSDVFQPLSNNVNDFTTQIDSLTNGVIDSIVNDINNTVLSNVNQIDDNLTNIND